MSSRATRSRAAAAASACLSLPSAPPLSAHEPVPASLAESMGHPRCVFVTGGPRAYLPGINCIGQRLAHLGSAHPLLVVVEPEDEGYMRRHVQLSSFSAGSTLHAWKRFPTHADGCGPAVETSR